MGLIDDLMQAQVPGHVKISPNGKRVVYTTATISRAKLTNRSLSTLWLAYMGRENSAHPISSGEYNDRSPKWSPDGESIAFVSDREKPGETSAIYILPINDGGETYALTAADNERAIEDFRWSPDGKCIAYISADEKTPEMKQLEREKNDANAWGENLVYSCLRLVDVTTKKVTTLVAGVEHVTGLAWSPDGTHIAVISTRDPGVESEYLYGSSISVIEVCTKETRPVLHFASVIASPMWVGSSLFFTGNVAPTFLSSSQALWSVDLGSDKPEFRRRAHGDDDCIAGFVQIGQDIVTSAKHGVDQYIHGLDGKTLQTYSGDISSFDAKLLTSDRNEMVLAVVRSSIGVPFEVYSTTVSSGAHVQLSSHGDALKEYEFGTATVLECQSSDKEVNLDATYFSPTNPKSKNGPSGPFPTAVICHGGPYGRSTDCFNPHTTSWLPVLVEAGYGVLMPNYRGGSGRGVDFAAYARGRIGTVDYDDVITLTQHAIEKGFADRNLLLIAGWSNGGCLANLASVRNGMHGLGWRFRAAIAGAGSSDPDTMRFTSNLAMAFNLDLPGMAPWDSEMHATGSRDRSAVWSFKKAVEQGGVVPPMLIMHGELDRVVPFEQAVGIRRALQHHKLPFEFVSYPREPHRIVEWMHIRDRMERALRWANTYISPDDQSVE